MSEQAEYTYDVFISYSHADKAWVWNELLPWLEGAGLRVCIDDRDFEPGLPSLLNMENAVERSRKTLIVLTSAWVESEWTNFESLLIQTSALVGRQRRMIPLWLEPCEPPQRIGILTHLDFTQPEQWENQLQRLITTIRAEPAQLDELRPPQEETRERRVRGRIPVLYRPLIGVLRAQVFQRIGAIVAVLAFLVAIGTWFWPDIITLLFPTMPTATPTSIPVRDLTDTRVRFTVTFSTGDELEVPAGGTLTLAPGEGILIETIITVGQSSFPRHLTYHYRAPVGGIPEKLVGSRTSYVAPNQPGPDFITVLITDPKITDPKTKNRILRTINVVVKEESP